MSKYYAVRVGRQPGIYRNWPDCEKNVKGFSGAIFKSFASREDAERFIAGDNISFSNSHVIPDTASSSFSNKDSTDSSKKVWVDGSFRDGKAGYAVVTEEGVVYYGSVTPATNNRGELTAILRAVEIYQERPLTIYSDSNYSIRCLTEWMPKWKARYGNDPNRWRNSEGNPVSNVDLLIKIEPLIEDVSFVHVRAHQGNTFNEIADRWANLGRFQPREVKMIL